MSKTNNVHFITAAVCSGSLLIVQMCMHVYVYVYSVGPASHQNKRFICSAEPSKL